MAVKEGVDEFYASELESFQKAYKSKVAQATEYVKTAKNLYGVFSEELWKKVPSDVWQKEKSRIIQEIFPEI